MISFNLILARIVPQTAVIFDSCLQCLGFPNDAQVISPLSSGYIDWDS